MRSRVMSSDLVVMSYETLRSDAAWAAQQRWLYAVLDEGHAIRNPKSKIAQVRYILLAQVHLIRCTSTFLLRCTRSGAPQRS